MAASGALDRQRLLKTQRLTDPWSSQSSSGRTRRLCLSLQAIKSTILCTCPLGTSITTCGVLTVTPSCLSLFSPSQKVCKLVVLNIILVVEYTISAEREHSDTEAFRVFKKKLYHASLVQILEPLRPGMTTPQVLRCPDGHFRRAIFSLGPFIADYPEQVYLSGIVSGWCPK